MALLIPIPPGESVENVLTEMGSSTFRVFDDLPDEVRAPLPGVEIRRVEVEGIFPSQWFLVEIRNYWLGGRSGTTEFLCSDLPDPGDFNVGPTGIGSTKFTT